MTTLVEEIERLAARAQVLFPESRLLEAARHYLSEGQADSEIHQALSDPGRQQTAPHHTAGACRMGVKMGKSELNGRLLAGGREMTT